MDYDIVTDSEITGQYITIVDGQVIGHVGIAVCTYQVSSVDACQVETVAVVELCFNVGHSGDIFCFEIAQEVGISTHFNAIGYVGIVPNSEIAQAY